MTAMILLPEVVLGETSALPSEPPEAQHLIDDHPIVNQVATGDGFHVRIVPGTRSSSAILDLNLEVATSFPGPHSTPVTAQASVPVDILGDDSRCAVPVQRSFEGYAVVVDPAYGRTLSATESAMCSFVMTPTTSVASDAPVARTTTIMEPFRRHS